MTRRPAVPVLSLTWLRRRGACGEGIRFAEELFGPRPRRLSRRILDLLLAAERPVFFEWLVGELSIRRPGLQAALSAITKNMYQQSLGADAVYQAFRVETGQSAPDNVYQYVTRALNRKTRRAMATAVTEYFNL